MPVFHSKDLVNWEQIGHCIERPTQMPKNLNIFAATIRYHEGNFYMITTNVGGFTGIYAGLYASGNGKTSSSFADYDWFEYKAEQPENTGSGFRGF